MGSGCNFKGLLGSAWILQMYFENEAGAGFVTLFCVPRIIKRMPYMEASYKNLLP